MKIASCFFLVLFVITSPASAQSRKPSSIAELAVYRGPDREQILYAGAKAEGKIIWYTSLAGDSYKEMVKAFETRYSGVKVESYRAAGAELVTRLEEEGKARRNIADTIETTEGSLIFLRDDKLLRPYDSPHLDRYPEDGKERADKNTVYWALARESYIGLTYNKTLVPKEAIVTRAGAASAFVVKGDSVESRQVKTGIASGGVVEVVSGLTSGEEVVVAGQAGLIGAPGMVCARHLDRPADPLAAPGHVVRGEGHAEGRPLGRAAHGQGSVGHAAQGQDGDCHDAGQERCFSNPDHLISPCA